MRIRKFTKPWLLWIIITVLGFALIFMSGALSARTRDADSLERLIDRVVAQDCARPGQQHQNSHAQALISDKAAEAIEAVIREYRQIVFQGGWPILHPGRTLAVGQRNLRVRQLRERLLASSDLLAADNQASDLFDQELSSAVIGFQYRHGLETDGLVGHDTVQALNVPASMRLTQLHLNLHRRRQWQQHSVAPRYVLVNIPAFELIAIDAGMVELVSPAIIGRTDRQTPRLSAAITAVNFHPTWYVPNSILRRDLLPKLATDPGYFYRENYLISRAVDDVEIDPFSMLAEPLTADMIQLQQLPGPDNALGMIRLDMPNAHTVYLHDTSSPELFARESLALSSGCVRVRKIVDLTIWALAEQPGWGADRINQTLREGEPLTVRLDNPIDVHFVYVTAWADPQGRAHFRNDIYRKDIARPESPP